LITLDNHNIKIIYDEDLKLTIDKKEEIENQIKIHAKKQSIEKWEQ